MKSFLRRLAPRLKRPIEWFFQLECRIASAWVNAAHKRLLWSQWRIQPVPEHFDHQIDLYYSWLKSRNSMWLERGVFASLSLKGGDVLELACGDGFNARNFYSVRSQHVIACDFDPKAISTAKAKNSGPNIDFVLADIRTEMPQGTFDNIVWDAAIEHFTPDEIAGVLRQIKERLLPNGILAGYTITAQPGIDKQLVHHEYEFKNKADLLRFFVPHFKNVTVFETFSPERHNLYFWASDGIVPFSSEWDAQTQKTQVLFRS